MTQQWLDAVACELRRSKLPRRQIHLLLNELQDHLSDADVAAAGGGNRDISVCDRLGRPEDLAQSAWANYRAAHYVARHPLLVFLISPVLLCLLGWTVAAVGMIAFFKAADSLPWIGPQIHGRSLDAWPAAVLWFVPLLELLVRIVPPAAAALLCCTWSEQLHHGGRWRLVSCGLVAAMAGLLFTSLVLPLAPGQGRWSVGLGFPSGHDQLLQFSIPPLVAFWWSRRPAVIHERVHAAGT